MNNQTEKSEFRSKERPSLVKKYDEWIDKIQRTKDSDAIDELKYYLRMPNLRKIFQDEQHSFSSQNINDVVNEWVDNINIKPASKTEFKLDGTPRQVKYANDIIKKANLNNKQILGLMKWGGPENYKNKTIVAKMVINYKDNIDQMADSFFNINV